MYDGWFNGGAPVVQMKAPRNGFFFRVVDSLAFYSLGTSYSPFTLFRVRGQEKR